MYGLKAFGYPEAFNIYEEILLISKSYNKYK